MQISQTITDGSGPWGNRYVSVQGKYAYIVINYVAAAQGELQIFDISNPYIPVSVGKIGSWAGIPMTSMYVRGHYLYGEYTYGHGVIIDISNPSGTGAINSSRVVGYDFSRLNANLSAIDVSGKYLYMVGDSGILEIYNISNPTTRTFVGSVTATTAGSMGMVKVIGRYAYVVNSGANQLQVFDVSNPAVPTQVNSTNLATVDNSVLAFKLTAPSDISIQGRYAYITSQVSNKLQVFDISSSTNPVSVGSVATGVNPLALAIKGRYAYVLNYSDSTMQVFDLGGAYIQQLEVGGLDVGSFIARDNAQFGKDLKINGGLTVGYSALFNSSLAVTSSSGNSNNTTFSANPNGLVGIGTPIPTANLQVAQGTGGIGTVSVSGTAVTGVATLFTNTFKVGDTITVTTTSGVETKAITTTSSYPSSRTLELNNE